MRISWTSQYLLLLFFLSFAECTPRSPSESLQRRQYDGRVKGVVSGIATRDANGTFYIRREVRDLHDNYTDQWNLYLLALEKLQWEDESDPYSYFGLASIHGRPYRTWEDAPGIPSQIGTRGYCPHNNQLFLGWHRPYIALFEQVLHQQVLSVAKSAPSNELDRYLAAANAFRLPYWDWALGDKVVPEFFLTETITVTEPSGKETLIWNPLYTYRFRNVPADEFDDKYRYINQTVRWPVSGDPDAGSQPNLLSDSYASESPSLITEMGTVFRSSTFQKFAGRLEQPHGWIHGVVGGGWYQTKAMQGHFWPLEYSAFDPVFMLHHTNVDRLSALYQAAHPDSWMERASVGVNGNVFLENYSYIDADTPLLPFRNASGSFWTSNAGRNHTVFGYTYPELQRWKYKTDGEYQKNVTAYIATTYGGSVRGLLATPAPATAGTQNLLTSNRTFTDWTIETSAVASAAPHTFIVTFSFGSDTRVGTWMVLMPSDHTSDNVQNDPIARRKRDSTMSEEHTLSGTVSLTTPLIYRIGTDLESLDPRDVVPFLTQHLTWEVKLGDGTLLPAEQLSAFTFEIFSSTARIPEDDNEMIEYEERGVSHPDVTVGKMGGAPA